MSSTTQPSSPSQPQPTPPEQSGVEPNAPFVLEPAKTGWGAGDAISEGRSQPDPTSNAQSTTHAHTTTHEAKTTLAKPPRPNPNQPQPPRLKGTASTGDARLELLSSSPLSASRPVQPGQSGTGQSGTGQSRSPQPKSMSSEPIPATQPPVTQPQVAEPQVTQPQVTQPANSQPSSMSPEEVKPNSQPEGASGALSQPKESQKSAVTVYSPKFRWRLRGWVFAGAIALVSMSVVILHLIFPHVMPQMVSHIPIQVTLPSVAPLQVADAGLSSPQWLKWASPAVLPKTIPVQEPATADMPAVMDQPAPGYGHFVYREATPNQLMVVGSYAQEVERLDEEAGLALLNMIDAARQDGVWLVPISGFRDFARQEMLFQNQIERVGSPRLAARSVAPAGYSEHHTGYAVDLADGLARAMDLSLAFGDTPAYDWLTRHADRFGFELSFPEENGQGVMYEPWHWRFVDSPRAMQTFAQARLE